MSWQHHLNFLPLPHGHEAYGSMAIGCNFRGAGRGTGGTVSEYGPRPDRKTVMPSLTGCESDLCLPQSERGGAVPVPPRAARPLRLQRAESPRFDPRRVAVGPARIITVRARGPRAQEDGTHGDRRTR